MDSDELSPYYRWTHKLLINSQRVEKPLSYSGASGVPTNSPGVGGTRPYRVKVRLAHISLEKVWVEALQVLLRNP